MKHVPIFKAPGAWLVATGLLHTAFGLLAYSPGWAAIARQGLWNAVDGDLEREHAFWFTIAGPAMILTGALMIWIERHAAAPLPRFLGWTFLAAGVALGVVMPVSGFWLLIPIGAAVLRR